MRKAIGVLALLVVLYAMFGPKSERAKPAPRTEASATLQADSIAQFRGMLGISSAEWVDGDFVIGVVDNGQSWQPVTESACAWLRQRGAPSGMAVVALESQALRNGKWTQMARARCN